MTLEQLIDNLPRFSPPPTVWENVETSLDLEQERTAVIHAFYAGLENGTIDTMLLASGFHFSGPLGTLDLKAFQNTYTDAYSGKRIEVMDILMQNEQAAVQLSISGEHLSPVASTDWIEFEGKHIRSIRSYYDASSMTNQMLG